MKTIKKISIYNLIYHHWIGEVEKINLHYIIILYNNKSNSPSPQAYIIENFFADKSYAMLGIDKTTESTKRKYMLELCAYIKNIFK